MKAANIRNRKESRVDFFNDLEEIILGAVLVDSDAIHIAGKMLRPEMFNTLDHQAIYTQMIYLYEKSIPVDLATLSISCKKAKILEKLGGPSRLVDITNRIASAANLEHHIKLLMQEWLRKEIIRICNEGKAIAINDEQDSLVLLPDLMTNLLKISDEITKGKSKSLSQVGKELLQQIEAKQKKEEIVPLFNLNRLDNALDGMEKGDFIIIGARPGMGKSSLLNNAIMSSIENKIPVYFMSLEMTDIETMTRLVSAYTGINGRKIKRGDLTEEELLLVHNQIEYISTSSLVIDEIPGANVLDFRSRIISYKRTHDVKVAILDRIGLLEFIDSRESTLEGLKRITKMLRRTAKELGICIIAVSQLNRSVDTRIGSKEPILSDLRDSGSLEQDAKKIIFLYRPEYYNLLEDENGDSLKGIGIISIAKNTNGRLGKFPYRFEAETTQFKEFEELV